MPSFNINSKFAGYKAKTMPIVKIPKNVREALCIDKVSSDGTFKLEKSNNCLYDRCYVFEDIGYINLDSSKKRNTLTEFVSLFRGLEGQYKITIASDTHDMDDFLEEVRHPMHEKDYPVVANGLGVWINQKISEGTRDIRRILYLTITCRANSFEEASSYFATQDAFLQGVFRSLKSRIYRLSADERLICIQKMLRAGGEGITPTKEQLKSEDWKNQVMPASIEQDKDFMIIDHKYASVLFGHDFGQTLNEETLLYSLTD